MKTYFDTLTFGKAYHSLANFKEAYSNDLQNFTGEYPGASEQQFKAILRNTYRHAAANIEDEVNRWAASELMDCLRSDRKTIEVQIDHRARIRLALEFNRILDYLDEVKEPAPDEAETSIPEPSDFVDIDLPEYVRLTSLLASGQIQKNGRYYYLGKGDSKQVFSDAAKLARDIKRQYSIEYDGKGLAQIIRDSLEGTGDKNLFDSPAMIAQTSLYCEYHEIKMTPEFTEAFNQSEKKKLKETGFRF